RVVDQYVQAAEAGDGCGHGLAYRCVVGDIGPVGEQWLLHRRRVEIQYGDLGTARRQQFRGGVSDAGGAAGHQGLEALEVAHAACPFLRSRSAAQKVPPGYVNSSMDSGRMVAEKPGAAGAW